MNNYRKSPFVPAIQKTSNLVYLSLVALICFLISYNSRKIDISPSYDQKVLAAKIMKRSMEILKEYRLKEGVFIDIENDPNETGLIGTPFSLITTDEGDLDAKLTTLDPNFAAVIVDLMLQINLGKDDTIAVLMTGSMPGANLAVLSACKALNVYPVIITSLGASQWGANQVDFTWLDMESILFDNDFIHLRSMAASIGGRNDMGRLLSPSGRKIITENIEFHGINLINGERLAENIQQRMELFSSIIQNLDYSAFINIGGGVASLGTSFNLKLLPPGILNRSDVIDISRSDGIEGVLSKFAKNNIPIIHILNIRSLIEMYNLPFAPIPIPEIGAGNLYAQEKYNLWVAAACLFLIGGSVIAVGYQSKRKIKEHLINHEPDSLL